MIERGLGSQVEYRSLSEEEKRELLLTKPIRLTMTKDHLTAFKFRSMREKVI